MFLALRLIFPSFLTHSFSLAFCFFLCLLSCVFPSHFILNFLFLWVSSFISFFFFHFHIFTPLFPHLLQYFLSLCLFFVFLAFSSVTTPKQTVRCDAVRTPQKGWPTEACATWRKQVKYDISFCRRYRLYRHTYQFLCVAGIANCEADRRYHKAITPDWIGKIG
jgi:hypothetical protein